jgi:Ni,Fe-hydrogenase I large subunit
MLYSICATAQSRAAAIACREALGIGVESRTELAETLLVWAETAREHLWRVFIDWPGLLGEEVDRLQLPAISQLIPEAKQALFDTNATAFTLRPKPLPDPGALERVIARLSQTLERSVFAIPPASWYGMESTEALEEWMRKQASPAARYLTYLIKADMARLGQTSITALPNIDPVSLHQRLQQKDADGFIATPEWRASPRETGALSRQLDHPLINAMSNTYGNGLMTRLVARLLELASIPQRLTHLLDQLYGAKSEIPMAVSGSGMGLGIVEAGRGRLIHRARVLDGAIHGYQILAPTEWNFHPRGMVAEGLLGLPCGPEKALRRQASHFIDAVDPCVGYNLAFV